MNNIWENASYPIFLVLLELCCALPLHHLPGGIKHCHVLRTDRHTYPSTRLHPPLKAIFWSRVVTLEPMMVKQETFAKDVEPTTVASTTNIAAQKEA